MIRPSFLHVLAIAALTLGSAPLRAAVDESGPRLEQYASYDEFLRAKVAWESRPAAAPAKADVPGQAAVQPTTRPIPVPEGVDPTSETAPPPLAITGPEDLDVAVELAKDISHPDYTAPIRYHRSTHISFPLNSIDGSDMSQASVPGALQTDTRAATSSPPLEGVEIEPLSGITTSSNAAPAAFAGMSLGPVNGPSNIVVHSTN